MAAFFVGLFIAFVGWGIIANSAFTERGNIGFVVFLLGAFLVVGGIVELALGAW